MPASASHRGRRAHAVVDAAEGEKAFRFRFRFRFRQGTLRPAEVQATLYDVRCWLGGPADALSGIWRHARPPPP